VGLAALMLWRRLPGKSIWITGTEPVNPFNFPYSLINGAIWSFPHYFKSTKAVEKQDHNKDLHYKYE
jgi:hypothetical protein